MARFLPRRNDRGGGLRRTSGRARRAAHRRRGVRPMIQVTILAGGLGTRLGPLASQTPKALVPVKGPPSLPHVLALLKENALTGTLWCVGHHGAKPGQPFGDGGAAAD